MLEELERHEIEERQFLEPTLVTAPPPALEADHRQRRRMVVALALLLVALGLVLVKDRDFWFPSSTDVADSEPADDVAPATTEEPVNPEASLNPPTAPVVQPGKKHRPSAATKLAEPAVPAASTASAPRAVLPPLRIAVVAGGRDQVVKPGSPTVHVDMQPGTLVPPAAAATRSGSEAAVASGLTTGAGERVEITTDTRQALAARPVRPEYPLLARQMKVQGEVVLDAWIGQDGGIQTLSVVGGPSILADAAQTAVRQWRFKPHYQDGQPVATQARIAVDFTIRRTDN